MKKLSISKEVLRSLNESEQAEIGGGLTITCTANYACRPSCGECMFSSRAVKPYCWTN